MSRLSKNILFNLMGKLSLLILGFISVRYIYGRLGEDTLGIIYFIATINVLLNSVLEMGIGSTTTREVSAHFKKEPDYICNLIRTGTFLYLFFYVIFGLVIYFMAPILVTKWIKLTTMDYETAIYVLRILGIASLVALPRSFCASLIYGIQRMEFNNLINVTTGVLRQFGTILILGLGGNLLNVVYWFTTCYGLELVVYFAVTVHFFSLKAFIPSYSLNVIKRNIGFASNMALLTILWAIFGKADQVIISKLMTIGILGYYGVAIRCVSIGSFIGVAIRSAAFPSFSALYEEKNRNRLMEQYRKLQDLICFANVPILALVYFAVLPVFSYMFNEEIARMLHLPTTLLCLGIFMRYSLVLLMTYSMAMGKPEIIRNSNFYILLIILPLTVLLVNFYGLLGAALAYVSRMIFLYLYAVPKYCSKCLRISIVNWYWHVIKILILVGLTYALAWFILSVANDYSIIALIIAYTSATIVFLTISFTMISEELKETLFAYFKVLKLKIVKVA